MSGRPSALALICALGACVCCMGSPAPPGTSAATAHTPATPASSPAAAPSGSAGSPGVRSGLHVAQRGGAKLEWVLQVRASGEASLVERKLVCPERWEARCWQASEQAGTIAAEDLAAFHESLRSANVELKSAAESPAAPGAQLTTLRFEQNGSGSDELAIPVTGPGSTEALGAVTRLRQAFHPGAGGAPR